MAQLGFSVVFLFLLGCFCSVSALNVALEPTDGVAQYYLEGQTAEFACIATPPAMQDPYYVSWILDDEDITDNKVMAEREIINITSLHRENRTLTCIVVNGLCSTNKSLNLVVLYKCATSLTFEMNSEVVKDMVNVKIGRPYRFACNAPGLNPTNHTTWLIEEEGEQKQIETSSCDWSFRNNMYMNLSTEICLNFTKDHPSMRLICRVWFPADGTYAEATLNLSFHTPNVETSTELSATEVPDSDITRFPIMHTAVIVPVTSSLLICIAVAIVCIMRQKYQQSRTKGEVTTSTEVNLTEVSVLDGGTFIRSQKDYDFPRGKIALHEILGSGNFGHVYRATADGIYSLGIKSEVAVKILKESVDGDVVANFEKEIMAQKNLVKHPNIVCMLGYCTETQPFYLILEYVSGGNLQKYLRAKKDAWRDDAVEGAQPACPFQLLTFASDIANGMDYLSSMGCIHRDLSTRNILLSEDLVCKLSDFGLARDVSETEQYERTSLGLIPVRWLALECLVENVYTTRSDVWSFGVLLWEIVTLGAHPYRGMSASELIDAIVEGFRLPTPSHCNKKLYTVMKECWRISPSRRPSFSNLKMILDIMIPDAQIYLAMEDYVADKYT